ncbi:MAG: asparagine synthase (glutamine-hydrolyzing) [Ginsengibacter sp.]
MCRISGIINQQLPIESMESMVGEMCRILKRGGPDDEGLYADEEHHLVLGHRRLSLIDLSNCGHQPMSYADERYQITFNGEIYNYQEIKRTLQRAGACFKTNSDTEVILAAFSLWGTDSFDQLNGMFAFGILDRQEKKFYLVRDASGIKPLYYAATREGLAFASEIRGFKPIPYLGEENDLWPVYLMAYGHLPEPVTVLKQVRPLQKGSFLCYDLQDQTYRIECFKKYHFEESLYNRTEAIHYLKEKLQQSVKRHLIADAPIGVFLSGGLDSGIIALLAHADKQTRLNTLSIYFDEAEFSEKKYQDLLLKEMHGASNQFLIKEQQFHENLPDIFSAMDQPSCDGINTWFISKEAKKIGLKAVLSGIGGDELYGGYPSFKRMEMVRVLERFPQQLFKPGKFTRLKTLRRSGYLSLKGAVGKYLFLRGQFIPYQIARQLNISEEQVWQVLDAEPVSENINQLDPFNQASWIELNLFMQNQLLRDVDVMSMSHGIEIRVPFLDKEVVDLSMQMSGGIKSAGRLPKQILIDAFKDLMPEPVWNRPKMGFGFPYKKWLANDDFVKSFVDPGSREYKRLLSGNMHWSQFLSLVLIRSRHGSSVVHRTRSPKLKNTFTDNGSHKSIAPERKIVDKVMFLTLRTFSVTGGIEKVSKLASKALDELCVESGNELQVCSMYDAQRDVDEKYLDHKKFLGFDIDRLRFTVQCIMKGPGYNTIILSHANLLPVGYLIKLFSPRTKLLLIAHGIEAWVSFTWLKKKMLFKCDQILSVSKYTKDVLISLNRYPSEQIHILNNCLDPFLEAPVEKEKDEALLKKYHLQKGDTVLMTLTRLAARERYKGYDVVIKSLGNLKHGNPGLKYLIVGKYDQKEKSRLDKLIIKAGLSGQVIFAGFVSDGELAAHFNLADIYIMPSEKEGFGIVFIEAMYYNKPVIAGNRDGSVDALLNGKLGLLVNPESQEEVTSAITQMMEDKEQFLPDRQLLMEHFSFPVYKEKWREILTSNSPDAWRQK